MAEHEPIHLRPTAELAERVLLPGDPGRALALAQVLTEKPLMFNHHRGLWGYTGMAADGEPLTIQSTGMGGPSAAIVLEELIALGVGRAIRVGTCGALVGGFGLGDLLIVREALAADGTSRALGAGERVAADHALTAALEGASRELSAERGSSEHEPAERGSSEHEPAERGPTEPEAAERGPAAKRSAGALTATVASTDLFYEPTTRREDDWRAAGAVAVEMEAATVFAVGARRGIAVGCVLAVSDLIPAERPRTRIGDDALLLTAAEAMGRLALRALAR